LRGKSEGWPNWRVFRLPEKSYSALLKALNIEPATLAGTRTSEPTRRRLSHVRKFGWLSYQTVRGGWYPPPAVVLVSEDDGLAVCVRSFCLSCHTPMRDDPTIWSWIKEAEPEITEPDVAVVAVLILASAT
jgi:hypothetical protein